MYYSQIYLYVCVHLYAYAKFPKSGVTTQRNHKFSKVYLTRKLSLLPTQLIRSTENLILYILNHLTLVTMLNQNPSHKKHKVPSQ